LNVRNLFASAALLAGLALPISLSAAPNPAWTRPFPPFRIAGNLYYVGSEDLVASRLGRSPTPRFLSHTNDYSYRAQTSQPEMRDVDHKI